MTIPLATLLEERETLREDYLQIRQSAQALEHKGLGYESRRAYSATEHIKRALQSIESQITEAEACSDDDQS